MYLMNENVVLVDFLFFSILTDNISDIHVTYIKNMSSRSEMVTKKRVEPIFSFSFYVYALFWIWSNARPLLINCVLRLLRLMRRTNPPNPPKTHSPTQRWNFLRGVNCLCLEPPICIDQTKVKFPWHLHADPWRPFASMSKTAKHSNGRDICGPGWKFGWSQTVSWFAFRQNSGIHKDPRLCSVLDFSKRVYQGVRVKHTVKDLLAEKRSQQTNGPRYSVSALLLSSSASPPLHLSSQNKLSRHSWHSVSASIKRAAFLEAKEEEEKSQRLSLFTFWLCVVD